MGDEKPLVTHDKKSASLGYYTYLEPSDEAINSIWVGFTLQSQGYCEGPALLACRALAYRAAIGLREFDRVSVVGRSPHQSSCCQNKRRHCGGDVCANAAASDDMTTVASIEPR